LNLLFISDNIKLHAGFTGFIIGKRSNTIDYVLLLGRIVALAIYLAVSRLLFISAPRARVLYEYYENHLLL
jgi:hypothetical protein